MAIVWLHIFILTAMCFAHGLAINCYSRTSGMTSNGSVVECAGYSHCYSFGTLPHSNRAGCTDGTICTSSLSFGCFTCSTDYCNPLTPSSITCHIGRGSTVQCQYGINTCYSYTFYQSDVYYGCGNCSDRSVSCVTCSTNVCNTETPSAISCYSRVQSYLTESPGTSIACHTGITSCYSYTAESDSPTYYAGCGRCSISANASCVTCNTNNCNTMIPSSISCYHRYGIASGSNGGVKPCSTGVNNCYSYSIGSLSYSGCGVCNSTGLSSYGCTACNTNNCNINNLGSVSNPGSDSGTEFLGINVRMMIGGVMLMALIKFMV